MSGRQRPLNTVPGLWYAGHNEEDRVVQRCSKATTRRPLWTSGDVLVPICPDVHQRNDRTVSHHINSVSPGRTLVGHKERSRIGRRATSCLPQGRRFEMCRRTSAWSPHGRCPAERLAGWLVFPDDRFTGVPSCAVPPARGTVNDTVSIRCRKGGGENRLKNDHKRGGCARRKLDRRV